MKFRLIQTKLGVRVVNELGTDYTMEGNGIFKDYFWWCCISDCLPKWKKLTKEEFEEVKKLNCSKKCQHGRKKFLKL